MNTYLDCLPCFFSQAFRTARIATQDEGRIRKTLDEIGMMIREIPLGSSPPETGRLVYRKIREITGNPDPYRGIKQENTKQALLLYPLLKARVEAAEDRLLTAIRIAVAGNVIDYGVKGDLDLVRDVEETLSLGFSVCDYDRFRAYLTQASEILYIGDNAGECVFDRVLIEELHKPVTYVVRGTPVVNDAVYEDAVQAGIDGVATIMTSGTDAPGTVLSTCTEDFKAAFAVSKCIISKGQGNYEALSFEERPICFLLKAKCTVIAQQIGVPAGSLVLSFRQSSPQAGLKKNRETPCFSSDSGSSVFKKT